MRMEFAYDGGGLGKSGTATLYVDGVKVGEGKVAGTAAMIFSADDTCDVGVENGALVADDYPVPNAFTGSVNWVEIDVGAAAEDADHQIDPDELVRVAMARQ
jgi:arylsulfatase